jgi:hypothetical protein
MDHETIQAVIDLLLAGEQYGIGITFVPAIDG